MIRTVLNTSRVRNNNLFLGDPIGIQRYDAPKYPIFLELFRQQMQFIWMPERISLIEDKNKYRALSETEKFIFDSNLKWQTACDSLLTRGLDELRRHVTNEELETTLTIHSCVETCIHSFSYTHILRFLMEKSMGQFFDEILEDEEIVKRLDKVITAYDKLFDVEEKDLKRSILDTLIQNYMTEGILFYSSFVTSFYFGAKHGFKAADIVKEISRDENIHVANFANIFKILKTKPEEGFSELIESLEDHIYNCFRTCVEHEKDWCKYLFSKGDLMGLNEEMMNKYVEWIANNRLASIGYKKIFDCKKNPLGSWINPFFGQDSDGNDVKTQVAPQESNTITSYKIGAIDNDVSDEDFEGLF